VTATQAATLRTIRESDLPDAFPDASPSAFPDASPLEFPADSPIDSTPGCTAGSAVSEISLTGVATIASAAEFRARLLEAQASSQPLRLHLDQLQEVDICVLQLLLAAEREWRQNALPFTCIGPLQESVSATILGAGLPLPPLSLDPNPTLSLSSEPAPAAPGEV
jgi:anti-anti-sigma regulatory factor